MFAFSARYWIVSGTDFPSVFAISSIRRRTVSRMVTTSNPFLGMFSRSFTVLYCTDSGYKFYYCTMKIVIEVLSKRLFNGTVPSDIRDWEERGN